MMGGPPRGHRAPVVSGDRIAAPPDGGQAAASRGSRSTGLLALAILTAALLWPAQAAAQVDSRWRLVGQSASVRLYYDPSTLVREGDIRKVRELQDLDAPDPDGVRSRVYLNEYDCRNQMHRLGQMQSYAGPMLSGERRFDVREMGYWRRIPGGSVFAQVYQQVCPDGQTLRAAEEPPPLQRLFGPR
jgi:hypothetical protein